MSAPQPTWRPLTVLHLTDLHLCSSEKKGHYWNSESPELALAPHDQRGLLGGLARDLRTLRLQPDLVVVTGDLLDRGSDTGGPLALEFLLGLAERLRLPRSRFVLVPGNHDVLRVADPTKRYVSFDELYRQFYGSLRQPFPFGTPAHLRVERFDFAEELGVEVVGFNSCEALDPSTGGEHGSIGTAQRDRAEELLEASEGRELFRIAAMHHHLESPVGIVRDDYSVMDNAALIRLWLAKHRFQLALHGHQHVDWQSTRLEGDWAMAIIAGASAGVARYGRDTWQLQLGYQVIAIDEPGKGRRIRREYNAQSGEWIDAGRGAAVEMLWFGATIASSVPPPKPTAQVGASSQRAPTSASVRKLLGEVLKSVEDFDAFCRDYFFEPVFKRFSSGMDRVQKTTLLLTHASPSAVLDALREEAPAGVAEHEELIKYTS